jgi:hypothetical protein
VELDENNPSANHKLTMNVWIGDKSTMSTAEEIKAAETAIRVTNKGDQAENEQLKIENTVLKAQVDVATKTIAKLTEKIETDERARRIPWLKANTNLDDVTIRGMSLEQMCSIEEQAKILKPSKYAASVRPGVDAEPEQDARLTVPKKFKFGPKEV